MMYLRISPLKTAHQHIQYTYLMATSQYHQNFTASSHILKVAHPPSKKSILSNRSLFLMNITGIYMPIPFRELRKTIFSYKTNWGMIIDPVIITLYLNLMNSYIVMIWTESQLLLTVISCTHIQYCQPLLARGPLPSPQKSSLNVGA
jgi:hypothetical protein